MWWMRQLWSISVAAVSKVLFWIYPGSPLPRTRSLENWGGGQQLTSSGHTSHRLLRMGLKATGSPWTSSSTLLAWIIPGPATPSNPSVLGTLMARIRPSSCCQCWHCWWNLQLSDFSNCFFQSSDSLTQCWVTLNVNVQSFIHCYPVSFRKWPQRWWKKIRPWQRQWHPCSTSSAISRSMLLLMASFLRLWVGALSCLKFFLFFKLSST